MHELIFRFKLNQYLINKLLDFWHFSQNLLLFGIEPITLALSWDVIYCDMQ